MYSYISSVQFCIIQSINMLFSIEADYGLMDPLSLIQVPFQRRI